MWIKTEKPTNMISVCVCVYLCVRFPHHDTLPLPQSIRMGERRWVQPDWWKWSKRNIKTKQLILRWHNPLTHKSCSLSVAATVNEIAPIDCINQPWQVKMDSGHVCLFEGDKEKVEKFGIWKEATKDIKRKRGRKCQKGEVDTEILWNVKSRKHWQLYFKRRNHLWNWRWYYFKVMLLEILFLATDPTLTCKQYIWSYRQQLVRSAWHKDGMRGEAVSLLLPRNPTVVLDNNL